MRRALLIAVIVFGLLVTAIFAGPVSSGGVFLLLPSLDLTEAPTQEPYKPLHKGAVDLSTGLYVRQNEDLVVSGRPALILRRTYLSGSRVSKEFGIGTTHTGEEYLVGDGERFQWVSLILARGTAITFRRTSSGTSFYNAMYQHYESSGEWQGARLGWTGIAWALRKRDGSLAIFQGCGPRMPPCSIIRSRDAAGDNIYYQRDRAGRLLRMDDGKDRWIAFDYDEQNRIVRARGSNARQVTYEYDARGRLSVVRSSDGAVARYTHTNLDELESIEEPDASIVNSWEHGRCIRQVNHYTDREPYTFEFTYHTTPAGVLVRTDARESDGTWTELTWDRDRAATSETRGAAGYQPAVFTYERDPVTKAMTSLTLTCPDRTGQSLRHTSLITNNNDDWIKWDLMRTHCSWSHRSSDPQ